jgi:hypothetical protein
MDLSAFNSLWIVFALTFSVFVIVSNLLAESFKGPIMHFQFVLRLFAFVGTLPILLFIPAPQDPLYYVFVFAGSTIFAYTDIIHYGLVSKFSAAVVARIEPLSSWILFFVWAALSPALLFMYLDKPLTFLGLVVSLTGCVFFAMRLRKCDVSWGVVKKIIPIMLMGVVGVALSKMAMDSSPLHSGIWYYVLCQSGFMTLFYCILCVFRKARVFARFKIEGLGTMWASIFTRYGLMIGLLGMCALIVAQSLKYYAISRAANPAYVTAFILISPFWIMLIYKARGQRENVDVVSGVGIVICTALLVFFTQF